MYHAQASHVSLVNFIDNVRIDPANVPIRGFLNVPQSGLNPINKNLSSEKFSVKNLRILNPQIFSEKREISRQNILVQLAGQICENFPQNILIGTHFENLRKFSEI